MSDSQKKAAIAVAARKRDEINSRKLSRETKRGLFWNGGDFAADKATKKEYRGEARSRVSRGQGFGALGGALGGAAVGGGIGAVGGAPGAAVGSYLGATAGAVAGASHGGKKAYRHLRDEGKVKKSYGGVSAFGIVH